MPDTIPGFWDTVQKKRLSLDPCLYGIYILAMVGMGRGNKSKLCMLEGNKYH